MTTKQDCYLGIYAPRGLRDAIDKLAQQEKRSRSQMTWILLEEAIKTREKK